ncbi:MAG: response regulator [Bacteroidales bacterium]
MSQSRGTVLIVESDPEARGRYELALARAGFRAVSAADAATALRLVSRNLPDVVLIELALPAPDAFHLVRRLRRQPRTGHVTVVALTDAPGDDLLLRRATENGVDTIVRRPTTSQDFARLVQACVQRRESAPPPQGDAEASAPPALESRPDERLLADADGARDVMLVDLDRGLALFADLFTRHPDDGLLYYKRGEGYRAAGKRKLAHHDFTAAAKFAEGEWRKRAQLAAMRTRSHHERPGEGPGGAQGG